jgi:hypothetical protein
MDRRFVLRMAIFGGLAVLFMLLLIPYLLVTTPLHVLLKLGGELAEKYNINRPVLGAEWGEKGRLTQIVVSYETSVFSDEKSLEREMNDVAFHAWELFEEYNKKVEKENRKLRNEPVGASSRGKHKRTFRPRSYKIIAKITKGGGCTAGKVETKERIYGAALYMPITQFRRHAHRLAGKVKQYKGLSVTVEPVIVFPKGPFGVILTCTEGLGEDKEKILQETADWVLNGWRFGTAKLNWVEIRDPESGKGAIAGEKPGVKKVPEPEPEEKPAPKEKPEPKAPDKKP